MKTSIAAKALANMPNFKQNGTFYLGTRNDDVMAGYCIDAPPNVIRIWSFALPVYDDVQFLHMSIGKIVVTEVNDRSPTPSDLSDILHNDWAEFSKVTDCESLIGYLDTEQQIGWYAHWVRYLTHIWRRSFDESERLYNDPAFVKKLTSPPAVAARFTAISEMKNSQGWDGCHALLEEWHRKTKAKYF